MAPLITGVVSLGMAACAHAPRSGPELLTVAERSFSDIPFGTREGVPGLTMVIEGQCQEWGECSYADANGVEHYFREGELVVKAYAFTEGDTRPSPVLGIGTARHMDAVLSRVERFLPEVEIECRPEPDHGQTCGATLGEGWINLQFDRDGRIREARLDAYHFT
ncbi:hypothetical protein [Brevundimonas sp. A19_0]|uniref:hypothetical protein n=1 Tax=Brevundimonas sp. A19_0 TaxID=2821087 RepID=UPI001ADB3C1B|nr:hypothetical protein [Brevundimonas sp. A19_0]MBO9502142.1 hypothetical protein [Brevundimonas sp. A19_0]